MTIVTKDNGKRRMEFDQKRLERFIDDAFYGYPHLNKEEFKETIIKKITRRKEIEATKITNMLINAALENISMEEPDWTFVAAQFKLKEIYRLASKNRAYSASDKYGSLFGLIKTLASKGIYTPELLEKYSEEEIEYFGEIIEPEKDNLYTYAGLQTLIDRYLAKDHQGNIYELPQERNMIIAMQLMIDEKPEQRTKLVEEAYWALSNLYMTVATPTLANSGKTHGQFSSCFIDTVDDSLRGIYDSNTDVATLSKAGGGIGVYMGKVRALGSDIKGFKGVSSGVVPWIRQLNNTAVSVDQLGVRTGAIAVYLDVWHKDIRDFLDLKLNNGDERRRAHDIFPAVCIPDLFMEQVAKRGEWYLFDPHEVRKTMGWSLEDFYDEEKGHGSFREKYWQCVNHPTLSKERVEAIEVMKRIMKSQYETGTPFMFYRDTVNRANPNKHAGIIYSSNLCTEIMQNMSPTIVVEEILQDGKIKITKQPGDFVVCNLSSINLGRAVPDGVLERLIKIQVRMLDNVIDLNKDRIEVLQAVLTNEKYRAIGLGTFGYHHLLVLKGIQWESDQAVEFADELYEEIAYHTIKTSMELAKEKGAYPLFEGSDWETGKYFIDRYTGKDCDGNEILGGKWYELMQMVEKYGIRNGYLMAVAPNGSTSIIAGSTASIDPIFNKFYYEEKLSIKVPVTAPDLTPKTNWFYKSAYHIDQKWSIKQNAARQRHVDQGISFNLYITNQTKAKELLDLHMEAWKQGLKTTYYVRSTSVEVEECESCAS